MFSDNLNICAFNKYINKLDDNNHIIQEYYNKLIRPLAIRNVEINRHIYTTDNNINTVPKKCTR